VQSRNYVFIVRYVVTISVCLAPFLKVEGPLDGLMRNFLSLSDSLQRRGLPLPLGRLSHAS